MNILRTSQKSILEVIFFWGSTFCGFLDSIYFHRLLSSPTSMPFHWWVHILHSQRSLKRIHGSLVLLSNNISCTGGHEHGVTYPICVIHIYSAFTFVFKISPWHVHNDVIRSEGSIFSKRFHEIFQTTI